MSPHDLFILLFMSFVCLLFWIVYKIATTGNPTIEPKNDAAIEIIKETKDEIEKRYL